MKFATLLTVVLEELSFKKLIFFFKFNVAMVIKQLNWVDSPPMDITAKYGSYYFIGYAENAI